MSTISFRHPDVLRARRVPGLGTSVLLGALVLLAISVLVLLISTSTAEHPGRAAGAQNSIAPLAPPVPAAPGPEIPNDPAGSPAIQAVETSEPSVVPVPAPSPAQAIH